MTLKMLLPISCLACSLVFCSFGAAAAQFVVYHSAAGDGTGPRGPLVLPAVPQTLHLYVAEQIGPPVASAPGEACSSSSAAGTEMCGWDFAREPGDTPDPVKFMSWSPATDVVSSASSTRLRANGGNHDQGTLGPEWIGDLGIADNEGTVVLKAGTVVGANLQRVSLPETVIVYVPEPGTGIVLVSGCLLLRLLHRRRAARGCASET